MNTFFKTISLFLIAGCFVVGCDKKDDLSYYNSGTAATLSVDKNALTPAPSDSNNVALTVNWTSPNYAADSSSAKYVVQIDSAGRNFSKAVSRMVSGALTTTFTAKELNDIALGYGFAFNTAYAMEMRVVSSYANNNDQKISNVVSLQYTPYKIPPKVALPASGTLFLVGSASQGGWNNPVPTPSQQFMQVDETTWAGVFQLNGGGEYLILPVNGIWDHKYSVDDKSVAGLSAGGDFGADLSSNIPGPADAGLYTITLDFQTGKFTVTPYTVGVLPDNLYMVGDATPGGWDNPVPAPSQQFTRLNSSEFELTVALTGGKNFLLLPVNGSWDHKFATNDVSVDSDTGGQFGYDAPTNFPGPSTDGTYKITVNFVTNTYTMAKQ